MFEIRTWMSPIEEDNSSGSGRGRNMKKGGMVMSDADSGAAVLFQIVNE